MRKKSSHHKNKPFRLLVVAALSLGDMFTSYLAWTDVGTAFLGAVKIYAQIYLQAPAE